MSHCPSHDADRHYAQIAQEEEFIDDMHLILTGGNTWMYCQCGSPPEVDDIGLLRWTDYQMVTDTHIQMEYICDNSECPSEAIAYIVALPPEHQQPDDEYLQSLMPDPEEEAAHQELVDKDMSWDIGTQEEWAAFIRGDGFYTAPEFLEEKFFLKTGKRRPEVEEE